MSSVPALPPAHLVAPTPAMHPAINLQNPGVAGIEDAINAYVRQICELRRIARPPPSQADRGKEAWMFLLASFVLSVLVWGFPLSFGVFQAYCKTHPFGDKEPSAISILGFFPVGLMYMFIPICAHLYNSRPSLLRPGAFFGLAMLAFALLAASYAKQISHLLLTQGMMYSIGGGLLYAPVVVYLHEWFVYRKVMAISVVWAGIGIGSATLPFLLRGMLDKWGLLNTFRIWSVIFVVFCAPSIFFLKPRIRLPFPLPPQQPVAHVFVKGHTHIFLQLSNFIFSLSYLLPTIHLASHAQSLGHNPFAGTILIAILNISTMVGSIIHILRSLRTSTFLAISWLSIGATIAAWFLGVASKYVYLAMFAISYGFFAGGLSGLWLDMARTIQSTPTGADATMGSILSLFSAVRGVALILSALISEGLYDTKIKFDRAGFNSEIGAFVVVMMATSFGALICLFSPLLLGRTRWSLLVPSWLRGSSPQ